jgi:hypothetical protein
MKTERVWLLFSASFVGLIEIDNYLVELDISGPVNLRDGANYRMRLVPDYVPKLKDQAFWSNRDNTTLFSYGGRGASDTSSDDGLWTYNIANDSWKLQQPSVKPVRLSYGGIAPRIHPSHSVF